MAKKSKLLLLISFIIFIVSCMSVAYLGSLKTVGFDGMAFLMYFVALGLMGISALVFLFSFPAAAITIAGEYVFDKKSKFLLIVKIIQLIAIIALTMLAKHFYYNPYEVLEIGIILYLLSAIIGLFTSIPLIFEMKGTGIKISDAIILYIGSVFTVLDIILIVLVHIKEESLYDN